MERLKQRLFIEGDKIIKSLMVENSDSSTFAHSNIVGYMDNLDVDAIKAFKNTVFSIHFKIIKSK